MTSRTAFHLAILAFIGLPMANCQQQEPISGGKPLSYWLERLDHPSDTTARAAIKEMGTNALPELIGVLRQVQPAADQSRRRALNALTCLGPVSKPALPDILPLVTNQNRRLKIQALFALKAIGPETELIKPIMPALLQTLEDPESTMRLAAINALAALHPRPPEVTPAFIRFLNDPNEMVGAEAVRWLVAQTNPAVLPTLNKQLNEKDNYIVTLAAIHLATFGPAAAGSGPRLKQLLNDPLITVRQAATNALAAIAGQPLSHSAPAKNADIAYNFPGSPLGQILDIYGNLAGKKVTMAATLAPGQTLRVITAQPLTKSEALQLLEEVLKQQAGVVIVHGKDGSLTAHGPGNPPAGL
jgi:HEAT repeat protein